MINTLHSNFKVVHLCMQDFGGAGNAAYRLHCGLKSIGIDSTMIVLNKKSCDPKVKKIPENNMISKRLHIENETYNSQTWVQQYQKWQTLLSKYPNRPKGLEIFTDPESTIRINQIKDIQEADIINLHWVSGLMDYRTGFPSIKDKAVVWTLHDMNPFTGGCHYSGECTKYVSFCGECPQLGSNIPFDLSQKIWFLKNSVYQNTQLNIVTPSKWLRQCANTSSLFSRYPVHVIPYGLPLDIYKPYKKKYIREKFNIPINAKVILFGADSLSNARKGFAYLVEALNNYSLQDGYEYILMTFGKVHEGITKINSKYRSIHAGSIYDEMMLSKIYSAADVFVLPSLEDNLPITVLKSIACGTPVVGFNIGGIPDMVKHHQTGFLVKPFDIKDLIQGINWIISADERGYDFEYECRKRAEKNYAMKIQAMRYFDIYARLINEQRKDIQRNITRNNAFFERSKKHITDKKSDIPIQFIQFMFGTLHFYTQIGDSNRHYHNSLDGLNYIASQINLNPDSYFWKKVALYFAKNTNFSTIYFTKVANLKQMFIQRARILQSVLQKKDFHLEYSLPKNPIKQKKIRLGVIKEHFKANTETYASIPVFEYLDKEIFEFFLYTLEDDNTDVEKYCQKHADHFILLPKDIKKKVQTIRNDNLDILFFATNLTASQNKATTYLALHRLAKIQVTSICSPVTTGLGNMDYFIAGNLTAPLPNYQTQYTEKLVNIEGSGLCFSFPFLKKISNMYKTRNDLKISEDTIVFISGSNFHKIIPEVRYTWTEILVNFENSVLILYPFNPVNWGGYHSAESFILEMKKIFAQYGVNEKRLLLLQPLPAIADIRSLLKLADIYLDAFPYSGATSLIDPLVTGLPPVVYEGEALRFRQGASILREIELPDLIVLNERAYIQLALDLAHNHKKRQLYQRKILSQMQNNPPFLDARAYAKKLTRVFKQMYERIL